MKTTRREFLHGAGLLAAALGLGSLLKAKAQDAVEFTKEATHVAITYGDMNQYYRGAGTSTIIGPCSKPILRTDLTPCENCHDDYFFEPWWCEDCEYAAIRRES